jgi:hypothetical protein
MDLMLTPEEATLLARIVGNYLSDLRMEIGSTDNYEWRQSLKDDETLLKGLLSRLPAADTHSTVDTRSAPETATPAMGTSSGPSE